MGTKPMMNLILPRDSGAGSVFQTHLMAYSPTCPGSGVLVLGGYTLNPEEPVMPQTFTWATAVQFANAGLNALWLFNGIPSQTPAQIKAAGIKFCGIGSNVTAATIAELKPNGIRTIGYTYNTAESAEARFADGVDGVFSDDPWRVSRRLPASGADPFREGYGWAGIQGEKKNGSTYSSYPAALSSGALDLYQHPTDVANLKWVYMDWAGRRPLPLRVSLRIEFPASTEGQTQNAGLVLYRNSINPDAGYKDAAEPGQQGLTFIARRSGVLDGWAYVDGAAATKIITRDATGEYAPTGQPGVIDLSVTITGTTISIEVPTHGQIVSVPYSFVAGGPLRFALRGSYAPAKISNVQIVAFQLVDCCLGGVALVNFKRDLPSSICFNLVFNGIQQCSHGETSNIFLVNLSVESSV